MLRLKQAMMLTSQQSHRLVHLTPLVLTVAALISAGCQSDSQSAKEMAARETDAESKANAGHDSTNAGPVSEAKEPIAQNKDAVAQKDEAKPSPQQSEPAEQASVVEPFKPLELLATVEADFISIKAIAFAPDGQTYVTAGNTPKIWKLGANQPLFTFEDLYPPTGTIVEAEAIAISADGKLLAIGGGDGITHLFDLATKESKHAIESHDGGVVSVSFSRDGKTLATSSYDGKAKFWNTETGEQLAVVDIDNERRVRSAITPDGKVLVSAGEEALLWSVPSGEKLGDLNRGEPRDIGVWAVSISADGKQIATGDATVNFENAALIWSTETRQLTATLKHEFGVWHVAFSPDGKLLATGDMNGVARIWRLADQNLVQMIEMEDVNSTDAIAWTTDGKVLAVAGDGTVRFWGPPGAIETSSDEEGQGDSDEAEGGLEADEVMEKETLPDDETTKSQEADSKKADQPIELEENRFGQVTPLTVTEAISIFEATQFPAPGGTAADGYSKPTSATFRIRDKFPNVVSEIDETFKNQQWQVVATDDSVEKRVAYYIRHQQLLIACKLREERESLTRMDVGLLGNVDIRSIPKKDVDEVQYDHLDYSVYRTSASLDEIAAYYDKLLTEAGWQKIRQFDGHDFNTPERRYAQYRNRGVCLNVSADSHDGQILASIFCELLVRDVPTPAGATDIELDDHLFRQRFRSTQSVSELVKFFTAEMKRFGWALPLGKQFENSKAGMLFTRPDGDPVFLELLSRDDGTTIAYMAGPTRQVSRAVKDEFEIEYEKSLPLSETQMHTVAYQSIPFNQPLGEGAGRTIAESVFFNTELSLEDTFNFYRAHFSQLGWEPGKRDDQMIGDQLHRASMTFKKADAEIVVTARPWGEGTNRVNIEGSGIEFPGNAFCHMLARPSEATDIE